MEYGTYLFQHKKSQLCDHAHFYGGTQYAHCSSNVFTRHFIVQRSRQSHYQWQKTVRLCLFERPSKRLWTINVPVWKAWQKALDNVPGIFFTHNYICGRGRRPGDEDKSMVWCVIYCTCCVYIPECNEWHIFIRTTLICTANHCCIMQSTLPSNHLPTPLTCMTVQIYICSTYLVSSKPPQGQLERI